VRKRDFFFGTVSEFQKFQILTIVVINVAVFWGVAQEYSGT